VKLLRVIALDPSDTFIFDPVAEPGEWAVSGAFRFWNDDPAQLQGKARSAFRSGFLGIQSWGWSTLVQIVEASDSDRDMVVERLAQQLVERLGAPDLATARIAAEDEVTFAESLCNDVPETLIAVLRRVENGEMHEVFRTLHPRGGPKPLRAFSFLDVEDDDAPTEDVDLAGMAAEHRRT
jgi:hypothetical protein